jgi:hypothetical protein
VIRKATAADLDEIVAIVAEFDALKLWPEPLVLNRDDFRKTCGRLLEIGVIFLSERGVIALTLNPSLFNYAVKVASELFFYAPDGRGDDLRKAAEAWAADKAQLICMGAHEPGPVERVSKWYRRKGYAPSARLFAKRIA